MTNNKYVKKLKIISWIIFAINCCSFWIALLIGLLIGKVYIFGPLGFLCNSWIFLCFFPFPIISFILASKLKYANCGYIQNNIVAFICIPALLLIPAFSLLFNKTNKLTKNPSVLNKIEKIVNFELPDDINIISSYNASKLDNDELISFYVSYFQVNSANEISEAEERIKQSELWVEQLDPKLLNIFSLDTQSNISQYDYYMFYNLSDYKYNESNPSNRYDCVLLCYNSKHHCFMIISEYFVDL